MPHKGLSKKRFNGVYLVLAPVPLFYHVQKIYNRRLKIPTNIENVRNLIFNFVSIQLITPEILNNRPMFLKRIRFVIRVKL